MGQVGITRLSCMIEEVWRHGDGVQFELLHYLPMLTYQLLLIAMSVLDCPFSTVRLVGRQILWQTILRGGRVHRCALACTFNGSERPEEGYMALIFCYQRQSA